MLEVNQCPQCGNPLPDSAPLGGCPSCMLAQGLQADGRVAQTSPPGHHWSAPSVEQVNGLFPQLEVMTLLGQGGMGAVYHARQTVLDREVALKILPHEVSKDPAFEERFVREARALAQLSHPNIVAVYEFGQQDGMFFLLMELVDGITLREAITDRTLDPNDALPVISQICNALEYAHGQGVVHRDIKPENILLDLQGRVKIADFGLAKLVNDAAPWHLTGTHQVMGTPHYMAPEQVERPLDVDHRADVFSLGVVFYELLTGQLPLGRFKLPSEVSTSDVKWDAIVLKTLERDPADRFQSVEAVSSAIADGRNVSVPPPLPTAAPPTADTATASPVQGTNPGPVLSGGINLLLGIILLFAGLRSGSFMIWGGLFLLVAGSHTISAAFDKSKEQEAFLKTPNLGAILHAVVTIWMGIPFLLVSPIGIGGIWIGIGLALAGSNIFAKAWSTPEDGSTLRDWHNPDTAQLLHGAMLILVGLVLFIWGWISHSVLFWIGFGLTLGGSGTLSNVWRDKK